MTVGANRRPEHPHTQYNIERMAKDIDKWQADRSVRMWEQKSIDCGHPVKALTNRFTTAGQDTGFCPECCAVKLVQVAPVQVGSVVI
jgi:hypothetical protein